MAMKVPRESNGINDSILLMFLRSRCEASALLNSITSSYDNSIIQGRSGSSEVVLAHDAIMILLSNEMSVRSRFHLAKCAK